MLSAFLSAVAAVYTEWVMKQNNDSLFWQNMQLYTFGVAFNALGLSLADFRSGARPAVCATGPCALQADLSCDWGARFEGALGPAQDKPAALAQATCRGWKLRTAGPRMEAASSGVCQRSSFQ